MDARDVEIGFHSSASKASEGSRKYFKPRAVHNSNATWVCEKDSSGSVSVAPALLWPAGVTAASA